MQLKILLVLLLVSSLSAVAQPVKKVDAFIRTTGGGRSYCMTTYDGTNPIPGLKANTFYEVVIYDGRDIVAYKEKDKGWTIIDTTRAVKAMLGYFEDEAYRSRKEYPMRQPPCTDCKWTMIDYCYIFTNLKTGINFKQ